MITTLYIANLRSIGCPEQTIHDIIAADLDSVYASRRQSLEDKLATNGVADRQALQRELQQLGNQEASAVTTLLAPPPGTVNTTSALAAGRPGFQFCAPGVSEYDTDGLGRLQHCPVSLPAEHENVTVGVGNRAFWFRAPGAAGADFVTPGLATR